MDTFVLIVGGGPVGLTAAIDLEQRGIPAILITENIETATQPRCNFVNARAMEHYRRLGLSDEIRNAAPLAKIRPRIAYATRFCGYEFGSIDVLELRRAASGGDLSLQTPEPGINISQLFLEPLLRKRAESSKNVDVRFGVRLVGFDSRPDCVIAMTEDVRTGARSEIRAKYAIAADGARSPIRKHFDIGMSGNDDALGDAFVSGTMMTYFFKAPTLLAESGRPPTILTWIVNHELRAFVFMQDGGTRWIMHYNVPQGTHWENVRAEDVIPRALGKNVPFEIIDAGPWTGGLSLVADKFQAGRAFLVGDAAHLFTPLGGFGMNTGVGDALNLTWKLAAVHDGWGGPALLDSYEVERRPIGYRNTRLGVHCSRRKGRWELPRNIEESGPDADLARAKFGEFVVVDDQDEYETSGLQLGERYDDSPIVCPDGSAAPPDTWAKYQPNDFPGARAPHFWLSEGKPLYDAFGPGLALIDFDSGLSLEHIIAAAKDRNVPLAVVQCGPLREPYRSRLVLVRADQHIAWHGDELPDDAIGLIDRVRGA